MNEMYIVSFNSTHHAIRLDKLLGEALNTLDIVDGKIASITITKEMLKRNVISFNDVDGITSYTRDIEGVEVGILLKEKKRK